MREAEFEYEPEWRPLRITIQITTKQRSNPDGLERDLAGLHLTYFCGWMVAKGISAPRKSLERTSGFHRENVSIDLRRNRKISTISRATQWVEDKSNPFEMNPSEIIDEIFSHAPVGFAGED